MSDVRVGASKYIVRVVDRMGRGGGFTAKELATTARVVEAKVQDRHCVKFLSFPAAPVATGMRGVLVEMIREGMVDAIITASGTLDHDIGRSYSAYYRGDFMMDDVKLYRPRFHGLESVLPGQRGG